MKNTLTFFVIIVLFLFKFEDATAQLKYHSVIITLTNDFTLKNINDLGIELEHGAQIENSKVHCIINDDILDSLKKYSVHFTIDQFDLSSFYAKRIAEEKQDYSLLTTDSKKIYGSLGNFFTLEEIYAIFSEIEKKYPTYIRRDSIGVTFEGRPLYAYNIGKDIVKDSKVLPRTLITSLHHAREALTATLVCYFVQDFFEKFEANDPFVIYILNNSPISIIPCLNPDGYEYNRTSFGPGGMWRKNRRIIPKELGIGVDLNRNYGPFEFWDAPIDGSATNSTYETYRGDSAFSEAETKAVKSLIETYNIKSAINFHSSGDLIVTPLGYNNSNPIDSISYHYFNTSLTSENKFPFGNCFQSYNYLTRGDAIDYMYMGTNKKILAITPELGNLRDGFWPEKARILPLVLVNISSIYSTLKSTISLPFFYSYKDVSSSPTITEYKLTFANPSFEKTLPCELEISTLKPSNKVRILSTIDVIPSINVSDTFCTTLKFEIKLEKSDSLQIEGIVLERKYNSFSIFDTIYLPLHHKEITVLYNSDKVPIVNKLTGWFTEYDTLNNIISLTESPNSLSPKKTRLDAISKEYISLVGCVDAYLEFDSKWDFDIMSDGAVLFFKEIDSTRISFISTERMQNIAIYNNPSFLIGTPTLKGHFQQRIVQRASLKKYLNKIGQIGFQVRTNDDSTYNGFNLYNLKIIKYYNQKSDFSTEQSNILITEKNNQILFSISVPSQVMSENIDFHIYNILGQEVIYKKFNSQLYQYRNLTFSKDIFPSGAYIVSIVIDGKSSNQIFTVLR